MAKSGPPSGDLHLLPVGEYTEISQHVLSAEDWPTSWPSSFSTLETTERRSWPQQFHAGSAPGSARGSRRMREALVLELKRVLDPLVLACDVAGDHSALCARLAGHITIAASAEPPARNMNAAVSGFTPAAIQALLA